MKLPKSFRLFGKTWSVKKKKLGESGNTCIHRAQVQIDPRDTSPGQVRATLLHEVVHCIEGDLELKMSEKLTSRLSVAMYGWMRDNPDVVKWLMEKESK